MRVGVSTVLVAILSVAIVTVLLAAPFAAVKAHDPAGNLQRDDVLGFQEYHDARATADSEGQNTETAPGTSYLYMLLPAVGLAITGILFLAFHAINGQAGEWLRQGAGALAAVLAAMVLHANALWAGKTISQSLTNIALGSDGPPRAYRAMIRDHSNVDLWSSMIPISAGIIVALTIGLFVVLGMAWVRTLPEARGVQDSARRHARLGVTFASLLALVLIAPMAVQNMPDGLAQAGSDRDTFIWSVQDILFLREVSWNNAAETGEAGLILWDGLSIAMQITIGLLIFGIVAAALGIAGNHIEAMGNPVLGRLLENVSLGTIIVGLATLIVMLMAAFGLHHPNDIFDARTTGLPLLPAAGAIAATVIAGFNARHVLATESGLVADDFPEPVVYE